VQIVPF